jgi:hypothetical protein
MRSAKCGIISFRCKKKFNILFSVDFRKANASRLKTNGERTLGQLQISFAKQLNYSRENNSTFATDCETQKTKKDDDKRRIAGNPARPGA